MKFLTSNSRYVKYINLKQSNIYIMSTTLLWWYTDFKNIPVKLKMIHLPLCFPQWFQNSFNNVAYNFKQLICEMNIKSYQSIWQKKIWVRFIWQLWADQKHCSSQKTLLTYLYFWLCCSKIVQTMKLKYLNDQ